METTAGAYAGRSRRTREPEQALPVASGKRNSGPALSSLRRLALALGISVGQLIEELLLERNPSRDEMDRFWRRRFAVPEPARPRTTEELAFWRRRIANGERRSTLCSAEERGLAGQGPSCGGGQRLQMAPGIAGQKMERGLRRIDKLAADDVVKANDIRPLL